MDNQSPFDLHSSEAYALWRSFKLDTAPRRAEDILVEIADPFRLSQLELDKLLKLNAVCNMAIYVSNCGQNPDKQIPLKIGGQLGLEHLDNNWLADEDALTPIAVNSTDNHPSRAGYIPYTNRAIGWHTDGYYNSPQKLVRSVILHCVHSATWGGSNSLLDHEIAYILLRDQHPELVATLCRQDAMCIPARQEGQVTMRAEQSGPVFSGEDFLHMRYTARSVSINWGTAKAAQAAAALQAIIENQAKPWVLQTRLQPGMGLVSNNVLHNRAAFSDDKNQLPRLLYRARYYQRIRRS